MKKSSGWLWGGVLVVLGVILGINALGIININLFFPGWWTLFIIVPSLVGLMTEKQKGGSLVGLVIGLCLLMSCLGILPLRVLWKLLLPALLVVLGVAMMRGSVRGRISVNVHEEEEAKDEKRKHGKIEEAEIVDGDEDEDDDDEDDEDEDDDDEEGFRQRDGHWSTLGTQEINYDGQKFEGTKVDAVFGGADVDLRHAKIQDGAVLKLSSIFGGVIVYVPEDVKVEVTSTAILGGVSDKRKIVPVASATKTLVIEATCVFGGVEIR